MIYGISNSVMFNIIRYLFRIYSISNSLLKSHYVRKTYSGPNNCQPERQYCMSCQALSVIIKSISQHHSWFLISDSFTKLFVNSEALSHQRVSLFERLDLENPE